MELAEEFERLGWQSDVISPADFAPKYGQDIYSAYQSNLRRHLREHAHEYDVVDYDHVYLPYARAEFHNDTLFVARAVLLVHHLETIRIPRSPGLRPIARTLVKGRRELKQRERAIHQAERTLAEADLVNVPNSRDKEEIVKRGIPESKIAVIPFGIDRLHRPLFDEISSEPPEQPTVAFVGTFDNRKGATDLPYIVRDLARSVTGVRFRFLGTGSSESAVLSHFDKNLRDRIEVVPKYEPGDLPELLVGCSVGVFPSYIEGFGLGVLEMLAASIPVIAYDSPGPSEILPPRLLVRPGDAAGLAAKAAELLQSRDQLAAARQWARQRSGDFSWPEIARRTSQVYAQAWAARQGAHPPTAIPAGLSRV